MKIVPYASAGNVALGANEGTVVESLGTPQRKSTDRLARTELHYSSIVVRVAAAGVVEVATDSDIVEFENISVPFERLSEFLRRNDPSTFAAVGFIVSPKYGVAFDPAFPKWVTAFALEELDKWRKHAA